MSVCGSPMRYHVYHSSHPCRHPSYSLLQPSLQPAQDTTPLCPIGLTLPFPILPSPCSCISGLRRPEITRTQAHTQVRLSPPSPPLYLHPHPPSRLSIVCAAQSFGISPRCHHQLPYRQSQILVSWISPVQHVHQLL